jgi:hypothetical protein
VLCAFAMLEAGIFRQAKEKNVAYIAILRNEVGRSRVLLLELIQELAQLGSVSRRESLNHFFCIYYDFPAEFACMHTWQHVS